MPDIYFKSVPFSKEDVTLALESGVDGIITEAEHVEGVRSLARGGHAVRGARLQGLSLIHI